MKKIGIVLMVVGVVSLISGCASKEKKPVIRFIGVATGSLMSPINALHFQTRFKATDHNLVGVVAFADVQNGTNVQATWFSPDDRRTPLGRTEIVTKSGATVARFSLSSKKNWDSAPFLFQVLASRGEGEKQVTASGSTQFFIGMTDRDVKEYHDSYTEWEKRDTEKRRAQADAEAVDHILQDKAQKILQSPVAILALRRDLDSDGVQDVLFLDTRDQPEYVPGREQGLVLSASVRQFIALTASGKTVLSVRQTKKGYSIENAKGTLVAFARSGTSSLHVALLTSGTLSLSWMEGKKTCSLEARMATLTRVWEAGKPVCE